MAEAPPAPPALRGLLEAGLGLAHRTTSGRMALSRAAGVVSDALLPARIRTAVRRELDAAHAGLAIPLDAKAVQGALKGAWGKPADGVLDDLADVPLSVSATAQVHAAELDGEPVAIKVARPGLAQTVRGELVLLDMLAGPLATAFPSLDVSGVLRELREAALDELDLGHEGDQQQRVRRALRRVDGVRVPTVRDELAADGVLVTERLDGPTLAADGAASEDPAALARALIAAHLTAWREAGLVLTDVRPSHVVLLDAGELGLLGAGVARPVARDRMGPAVAGFVALADPEPDAFVAATEALGVLGAQDAAVAHGLLRDVLGDVVSGGPARLDGAALAAAQERAFARLPELLALGARATPQPADLAALRMLGQLSALLSRLELTEDWAALTAAAERA